MHKDTIAYLFPWNKLFGLKIKKNVFIAQNSHYCMHSLHTHAGRARRARLCRALVHARTALARRARHGAAGEVARQRRGRGAREEAQRGEHGAGRWLEGGGEVRGGEKARCGAVEAELRVGRAERGAARLASVGSDERRNVKARTLHLMWRRTSCWTEARHLEGREHLPGVASSSPRRSRRLEAHGTHSRVG